MDLLVTHFAFTKPFHPAPLRNGDSVLHIAAERGDATLVELLISQGADLSCKNSDGNTPLHLLAIQSDLDPDNSLKYLQVKSDARTLNTVLLISAWYDFVPKASLAGK